MENQQESQKVGAVSKKKVWYQTKIEELEAKVAELSAQTLTVSAPIGETFNDGYAEGFFDCMHKYGVLSKLQRRRIRDLIKQKGPSAVKATKRTRFSLSVPSL